MNINIITYVSTYSDISEEEYGSWYVFHENDIKSITISKNKNEFDLIIENDFDITKKCYLVFAEYAKGNSFGAENGCLEYLKLFKTLEEATSFKDDIELLEKYASSNFKRFEFMPKLLDNIDVSGINDRAFEYFGEKFNLPWGGYFDTLSKLEIIELEFKE